MTESVYVKQGAPVVESLRPDTVWVNDSRNYTLNGHDVDGDSFGVDWDNNCSYDDVDTK